jgi:hypothetical protein
LPMHFTKQITKLNTMAQKEGVRNYQITDKEILRSLKIMAVNEDMSLQGFVERNITAMGSKGISYLTLWNKCEALTSELKQVQKGK